MDIATIEMYESTLSPEDMDMRRRSQSIIMEPLDYKVNYRCLPLVTSLPGCIGLGVKQLLMEILIFHPDITILKGKETPVCHLITCIEGRI